MKRNFKLIGGFGISQKEIKKRKTDIKNIIDRYYTLGIREFFIGYNPPYWHEKFGFEFSPNGRFGENEQITSYETFQDAVDYVHSLKDENGISCEIFLTINFWYYSDLTMPLIEKIIQESVDVGVDGLIIGNIETLYYLADIGYKGKINFSTILSIFNIDSIVYLVDYVNSNGLLLNRVILPREVTLKEIQDICSQLPNISFEIFGHGDYCRYSNGYCFAEHKYFSRDLCTYVLKHGISFRKRYLPNFKQIILDDNIDDLQKQILIDNSLNDLSQIFISQNVVGSNSENPLIDYYINLFENDFLNYPPSQQIVDLGNNIVNLFIKDYKLNFFKYVYDGLLSSKNLHNKFIDKVLLLFSQVGKYVNTEQITDIIGKIKNIRENAQNYYNDQLKTKGKFGLETYYKFLLYNRTSVPFYSFFNNISNIDVVKIPLRGRDLNVMKLGLDLIDDAIINPDKYIDYGNLSGKYFHYDGSFFDFYSNKFNN